jgi:hypothetical protein
MPQFVRAPVALLCAPLWLIGCVVESAEPRVASPDGQRFVAEVYPLLLRDCGFPACHGATDRFFSVYGPGRTRLTTMADPGDDATEQEIQHSYDRARSMVDLKTPGRSLLLRKPLAVEAGGAGHKGEDSLRRNVYQSTAEPGFALLRAWVLNQAPAMVATPGARP